MANYKITQNRKGELQAKIQVSGKDNITGNYKVYTKRVYNKDNLTEAKFRKQVDKAAIAFEEEITRALEAQTLEIHTHVLTFAELMAEWQESIKANFSKNYYERSFSVANKFNVFLQERHLDLGTVEKRLAEYCKLPRVGKSERHNPLLVLWNEKKRKQHRIGNGSGYM